MSNKKTYIITIDEPCHEAWDKMNPLGCDRFCNSCNKVVHDLTNFTEEALQKWAGEQKQPVCGRLTSDQLKLPEPIMVKSSSGGKKLFKIAASLLALTSLSSTLWVNAQKVANRSFKTQQGPTVSKPVLPGEDSLQFSMHGFVSDSTTGKPLTGARILVNRKVMAVTDTNGQYSFILPGAFPKAIIEVTVEKMNSHQTITDIVRLRKLPVEVNFALKEYEPRERVVISAGIVAIVVVDDKTTVPKKRTWYQKILGKSGK